MMNKLSKKKTIYDNYLKKGKKNSSFNLKKKQKMIFYNNQNFKKKVLKTHTCLTIQLHSTLTNLCFQLK